MIRTPPLDPVALKCDCAAAWSHPGVRILLGDALRPGGVELTRWLLDRAGARPGQRVLDVGCGAGATLVELRRRGLTAVGVDYSTALVGEAATAVTDAVGVPGADGAADPTAARRDRGADPGASRDGATGPRGGSGRLAAPAAAALVGDAERLPFAAAVFDGATVECVLSALPDPAAAVAELRRVLRPGGWLVCSDVTVDGALPEPLATLVGWIACAAGALPADGYVRLLTDTGFEVEVSSDRSADLAALLRQARRRLALLQAAAAVGLLPGPPAELGPAVAALGTDPTGDPATDVTALTDLAQGVLGQALEAVADGRLGYQAVVARRRG